MLQFTKTIYCLLFVSTLTCFTGCASFREEVASKLKPASKKEVKEPEKLFVAYAKWQEAQGNLPEARTKYQQALEKNNKSVDAMVGMARIDQLAGRTRTAEQTFLKAIETDPANPLALTATGQFYLHEKRYGEASEMLNRAVRLAPDDKSARYYLGIAMLRSGDVDGATPHLVESIGDAAAQYNIGLALYERGDVGAAGERFAQAIKIDPSLKAAQVWLDDIQAERRSGFDTGSGENTSKILQTGGFPQPVAP